MPKRAAPETAEKPAKVQRLDSTDYSLLPCEVLLKICSYIPQSNKHFINLSQTCKRFNEICGQFMTLRLDLDRIYLTESYPDIKRSYHGITFVGRKLPSDIKEIDSDFKNLEAVITQSRWTAVKLTISLSRYVEPDRKPCRMSRKTFFWLIELFPKLQELQVSSLSFVGKRRPIPVMNKLKKVTRVSLQNKFNCTLYHYSSLETFVRDSLCFKSNTGSRVLM